MHMTRTILEHEPHHKSKKFHEDHQNCGEMKGFGNI
jgi:hypothetical protein